MENPWERVPDSAPFLLEVDALIIERFNRRARMDVRVQVDLPPEPFLGQPDAPVVLLNLNPGWEEGDPGGHDRPDFAQAARHNLHHRPTEYPFFLLDPRFEATGGGRWWRTKLRRPIEDAGLAAVARGLLVVEFFPYHSSRYGYSGPVLPSQRYGFHLVERAMARDALVVRMRGERHWLDAVPSLGSYRRLYRLRNVQNVAMSLANCPDGYHELIRELRRAVGAG